MKETTMKEDTVVKKRLITFEEGTFWNFEKALNRIDEGTTEEEDDGAKEEEKENVEEDDVLEDSFDSEVSTTSSETEGIKEETSYEKRPEEALSQNKEGTMDVSLDVLLKQQRVLNDQLVTETKEMYRTIEEGVESINRNIEEHCDSLKAMMTNLMNIMAEREAVRYQEQQED